MSMARTAVVVTAGLSVPTLMYAPKPLYSGPGTAVPQDYDYTVLSQLAKAGRNIYMQHCVDCHGDKALGSEKGPSLHQHEYAVRNRSQQSFHEAITKGLRANTYTFGDMPAFRLTYNEIERVARYVREVRRLERE